MGWKGTVRTLGAMHRANVREEQRRQKELQRQNKEIQKMQLLEQASYEVDVYNNYIEVIQSVHKEHTDLIDWYAISQLDKPTEPIKQDANEKKFKVGFFSKLLGKEKEQKNQAIAKDEEVYKKSHNEWIAKCEELENDKLIANKLLSGNPNAKLDVIQQLNPFGDIKELGSSLTFEIKEDNIIETKLNLQGKDIIPTEKKALLQSGKLSVKKIPKGAFNEIYQDYVCSCVLRVGNELLAMIPDKIVLIHAMDNILNTKTGHIENQCIVSVAISRKTIESLNMDLIDPSDSLENFVHNMNFKKTKGFEVVKLLSPLDFV